MMLAQATEVSVQLLDTLFVGLCALEAQFLLQLLICQCKTRVESIEGEEAAYALPPAALMLDLSGSLLGWGVCVFVCGFVVVEEFG